MNLQVISTGSKGNAYLLSHGQDDLLLDAGVTYEKILKAVRFNPAALQGVLVTHAHMDHLKAVPDLLKAYVDVYASQDTFSKLDDTAYRPNRHILTNAVSVVGNWLVTSFSTEHDTDGSLGFFIKHYKHKERILYITDTGFVSALPVDVTVLIIECNFVDSIVLEKRDELDARFLRLEKYHMSLDRVKSYLTKIDRSKLHTVVLVHLSDSNADEARMIREVKEVAGCEVVAAHDGDMINLDLVPF